MKSLKFTRFLSFVLVLCMLMQMLPVQSFATDNVSAVAAEIQDELIDPYIIGEVEDLREEDTKHFKLSDGSYIAVSYGLPVHYEDGGKWKDIDNTFASEANSDAYSVHNSDTVASFSASLNDGSLLTVQRGTASVSMGLLDTAQAVQMIENESCVELQTEEQIRNETVNGGSEGLNEETTTTSVSEDTTEGIANENLSGDNLPDGRTYNRTAIAEISTDSPSVLNLQDNLGWDVNDVIPKNLQSSLMYENVYPGVDLVYTAFGYNIKEQIIVKARQETYRFDFLLNMNGLDSRLNDDGSVSLLDSDDAEVYHIPAPFMEDEAGNISFDVSYTLVETRSGTILTVEADQAWINSMDRALPVVIDPTLFLTANSAQNDISSTYVTELECDVAKGTPHLLHCGAYAENSVHNGRYRTFLHINTLPDIPDGAYLVDANLNLFMNSFAGKNCTQLPVGIYEVTGEKPTAYSTYSDWFSAITWNNQPAYNTSNVIDYAVITENQGYVSWNITELVKQWYIEGTSNTTVCLSMTNEDEIEAYLRYAFALFYGNASDAPPVVVISYRSNTGIEPYYSYATLGGGEAGTAYISDATGQLKVVKELLTYASSGNPFSLNLVYNSDYFSENATADYQPPVKMGLSMGMGSGWSLDCIQKVETEVIDETTYLKYWDGDGTIHYFAKKDNDASGIYYDMDGLGLKMECTGTDAYLMSDDSGNNWTFTNCYLTSMADSDNNRINIIYSNGRITAISQQNNGQASVNIAGFTYSGNNLTSVTDAAGNIYTLTYSGNNLVSIKKSNTLFAEYVYSGYRLTKMTDTDSNYALNFEYQDGRLKKYYESGGANSGASVDITYPSHSQIAYRDSGVDRSLGTSDDITTYYLFDYAGRTVNAYTTDNAGNVLGASNAVYSAANGVEKTNNRTLRSSSIGVASQQLLRNGSIESTASVWTLNNTERVTYLPRTGTYSIKGALETGAAQYAQKASESLSVGTTYTFSCYVNTSGAYNITGTGIYLKVTDSSGNTWTSQPVNYTTSTAVDGGWVRVSVTFTAKVSGSHTLAVCSEGAPGIFYADDFQLEKGEGPSSYNMVENGSMEMSNFGWTMNTGASIYTSGGAASSTVSLKIIGEPLDSTTYAYQDIPVNLTGKTYVLAGWVKANAVPDDTENDDANDTTKQCGLRAVLYYSDGTTETHYVSFHSDLSDVWQFTSTAIVPEKLTTTITKIRVVCAYEGNANIAYFDNISLLREAAQTMRYDADGNLISVATPGLDNDDVTYVPGTNLIKTVTGGNGSYTYNYDTINTYRLNSVTNGLITQSMTYDGVGNVTNTTLSGSAGKNITASAAYGSNGNLVTSVTDSARQTVSYGYGDANSQMTGLPTIVEDPKGTITVNMYDGKNRIAATGIAESAGLVYSYSGGNLSSVNRSVTGGSNQTYNFTYDSFGNMLSLGVGSRNLASYTYGAKNGLLTKQTYANGSETTFDYDNLGRIKTAGYSDGRQLTYTYNGEGRLHSTKEVGGYAFTNLYNYDSLGRLIDSEQKFNDSSMVRTHQVYNEYNQLTGRTWHIGSSFYTENYTYNTQDGSLNTMTTALGDTLTHSYDGLRRLSSVTNGMLTRQYSYRDISDNSTTMQVSRVRYPEFNYNFDYTYDALGNIATYDSPWVNPVTYTYDNQSQLLSASDGSTTYTYTYDAVGNIQSASNGSTTHSYTYGDADWKDLLTAFDDQSITYDASGNPTSYFNGKRWTMSWVNGRQLASASDGTSTYSYIYDAAGSRIMKNVGTVNHLYFYVNGMLLMEYRYNAMGDTTDVLQYFYDANGKPHAMAYNGTVYLYVTNLQGDIVALLGLDGSVSGYEYDPYGNVIASFGDIAVINPLRYRGYYYDNETGLYYLQSRYYDPVVGRFINADSYASTGLGILGNNMFAYCQNNPCNYVDFTGEVMVGILRGGMEGFIGAGSGVYGGAGSSGSLGRQIVDYYSNEDEAEVVDDDFIDFYKGVPVIKVPFMESSAFSFGIIFMGTEAYGESIVRHEYGHCVHLSQTGITNYAIKVVIPSVIGYWSNVPIDKYYSQPWEYIAEVLGNVNRSGYQYSENAESNAKKYWIFTMLP